ncbi:MAG: prepilin-type N-terminal cleavage/methylation domain-containing protein [Armatimonadota bacterium]
MNKTAFTLIELLVVIAIIAILAAILFPVFVRHAKKPVRRRVSLTSDKWRLQLPCISRTLKRFRCTPLAAKKPDGGTG